MTTTSDTESIHGYTAPGFEPLRDALARAVALDRRGGASLSVVRDGTLIAELAAGSGPDDSTPRTTATPQTCFSCTKGVVAVALLQLIERGQLELDAPVARYWPAFAAHGKNDILVRHVVSHTSGMPAFRAPVSSQDLTSDRFTEAVVAADEPWWPAGTDLAYQSLTYGAICGGLVREITGASVGAHVQREIATPLGLDLWIGLPEERERDVAPLHPVPEDEQVQLSGNPVQRANLTNPPVLVGPDQQLWNSRAYHAAEIPGAGGISTATGLARLYGCLAIGGTLDGSQILRPETVELGRTELSAGQDVLTPDWTGRFGVGFMLPTAAEPGYDPLTFGHSGFGGQISAAWPTYRVGVSFLTTALRTGPVVEARSQAVLGTLAELLAGSGA
jgi:CubicO group peptidase (beta-lactamase class C family)